MKSSSGFGLMTVLMAVAIAGTIAAALATLYENMTAHSLRANVSSDAENFTLYLQGVLSQRGLCQYALRTAGGARIQMPAGAAEVDVPRVRITNGVTAPVVVAQPGMRISPALAVRQVRLRHRDTNFDDVGDATAGAVVRLAGVQHRVYDAELVIEFDWIGNAGNSIVGGRALKSRKIPLLVTVNTVSNAIMQCDATDRATRPITCNITNISNPAACPQPATKDFAGKPCVRIFWVSAVDANNMPICRCRQVCPPAPGTGPYPPPPPIPLDTQDVGAGPGPGAGPGAVSN